jgi:hypothetical protein
LGECRKKSDNVVDEIHNKVVIENFLIIRLFSVVTKLDSPVFRNMVHLPFFLQNAGLRKIKVAQTLASRQKSKYFCTTLPYYLFLAPGVLYPHLFNADPDPA